MGRDVERLEFSREDRRRYREKVRQCLDVFARMLRESRFDVDRPMTGIEVELNLVDEIGDPAMKNAEVLERIASIGAQRLVVDGLEHLEESLVRHQERARTFFTSLIARLRRR